MDSFELHFFNRMTGAIAVLTFANRGGGVVNLNVSMRHEEGLTALKMQRFMALWKKWGFKCIKPGIEGSGELPSLPRGWEMVRPPLASNRHPRS